MPKIDHDFLDIQYLKKVPTYLCLLEEGYLTTKEDQLHFIKLKIIIVKLYFEICEKS